MEKNIKYNGYTARPSGHEAPDGDLDVSLNLLNEDGSLRPLSSPDKLLKIPDGAYGYPELHLECVHKIPGTTERNYVFTAPETDDPSHCRILFVRSIDTSQVHLAGIVPAVTHIEPFGKFLVLTFADRSIDTGYLRWCIDPAIPIALIHNYIYLSRRPPEIPIQFSLLQQDFENQRIENVIIEKPDSALLEHLFPGSTLPAGAYSINSYSDREEKVRPIADAFHTIVNKALAVTAKKGYFSFPFLVTYAFRLFDGSHIGQSSPVLMIPSSDLPRARIATHVLDDDGNLNMSLDLGPSSYGQFSGQQGLNPCSLRFRICSFDSDVFALWKDFIVGIDIYVSPQIYQYSVDDNIAVRDFDGTIRAFGNFLPSRTVIGTDTKEYSLEISGRCLVPAPESTRHTLHDKISEISNFYRIATIPFDDIAASDSFIELELVAKDLNNLVTRPTLDNDYHSRDALSARITHSYNSRVHLASLICTPALSPAPSLLIPYSSISGEASYAATVEVYLRKDGEIIKTPVSSSELIHDISSISVPRFLFYPDADAFLMVITQRNQKYCFPLESHDFLDGAFWVDTRWTFSKCAVDSDNAVIPKATASDYMMLGKIFVSDTNNPFKFRASSVVSVDAGEVLALSSAARALSQGQFGQFPLYAFTSEGIWAIEVSASGTYSARQPITRDVCTNPGSITQIDTAVLFATDRGIMIISGSVAKCISDPINSDFPFDATTLKNFSILHTGIGHPADKCFPTVPFPRFLEKCSMIYDYIHQRILLFSPEYTYAYVYSLKSMSWGMICPDIRYGVPSYPEALAVDNKRCIVDFSTSKEAPLPALLLTRPLKLDLPDILKTVDIVIQRGYFRKGSIRSVLYGSRDLFSWHIVRSSRDHIMRGFSGTPYKYYRIALICELQADESLDSATVRFFPRYTDRPR